VCVCVCVCVDMYVRMNNPVPEVQSTLSVNTGHCAPLLQT
jgi:hypothetical protein